MSYTEQYFTDALKETETARNLLICQAYSRRLEHRIKELHLELEAVDNSLRESVTITQEQVNTLMYVLDELPRYFHEPLGKIQRIKILRAAYNLRLKEAKDMVEAWEGYNKLPF